MVDFLAGRIECAGVASKPAPSKVTRVRHPLPEISHVECEVFTRNAHACNRLDTNHCTKCRTRKTKNALAAKAKYAKKFSRISIPTEVLLLSGVHRANLKPIKKTMPKR